MNAKTRRTKEASFVRTFFETSLKWNIRCSTFRKLHRRLFVLLSQALIHCQWFSKKARICWYRKRHDIEKPSIRNIRNGTIDNNGTNLFIIVSWFCFETNLSILNRFLLRLYFQMESTIHNSTLQWSWSQLFIFVFKCCFRKFLILIFYSDTINILTVRWVYQSYP